MRKEKVVKRSGRLLVEPSRLSLNKSSDILGWNTEKNVTVMQLLSGRRTCAPGRGKRACARFGETDTIHRSIFVPFAIEVLQSFTRKCACVCEGMGRG